MDNFVPIFPHPSAPLPLTYRCEGRGGAIFWAFAPIAPNRPRGTEGRLGAIFGGIFLHEHCARLGLVAENPAMFEGLQSACIEQLLDD